MENAWGANKINERTNPGNMIWEYMLPSSCWTEDTDSHSLLIDLPGFKNEEVRLRGDTYGRVIVSGERQVNDNKIIHFEQSFMVPANSADIEETSAFFEDEIFYITIPKKVTQVQNSISVNGRRCQTTASNDIENVDNCNDNKCSQNNEETAQEEKEQQEEEFHDANSAEEWTKSNLLQKVSKKLNKNRCVVLTAVVAFSFGVLVSHKCQLKSQVVRSK